MQQRETFGIRFEAKAIDQHSDSIDVSCKNNPSKDHVSSTDDI